MVVEQKHNSLEGRIADKISKLWKDTANVIIKIALESNENNIKKIVRNYPVKHSAFWSEDANYLGQNNHIFLQHVIICMFLEIRSRLALEVLPLFLPGTKKGVNSFYLYEAREVGWKLNISLEISLTFSPRNPQTWLNF